VAPGAEIDWADLKTELDKFPQTSEELLNKLGGLRWSSPRTSPPLEGLWREADQVYSVVLRSVLIETPYDNRIFRWLHTC
jgi:hypothetical protein